MHRPARNQARQRGVASLVVVMVLLFIVALVAAYTSRNMIFEQRTSTNQYRSTAALEAAEAGLEWAITMLNEGRIDAACTPIANLAFDSFRDRYVTINATTGVVTSKIDIPAAAGTVLEPTAYPTCVMNGAAWTCSCPTVGNAPAVAAPAGNGIYPAFRVHFRTITTAPGVPTTQPGVVQVEVNGCTSLNEACLRFPFPDGVVGEGRATVSSLVALASALPSTPAAALTARGTVNAGNGLGISVYNTDTAAGGMTVHSGDVFNTGAMQLWSVPGTPSYASISASDAALATTGTRLFTNTFNMWPVTYRDQPATVQLNCAATCTAATVRVAAARNPGRILWLNGDVNFNSPAAIGSAAVPVMMVVSGNVRFSSTTTIFGVIYGQALSGGTAFSLSGNGAATVQGALMAENDLDGNAANASIVFDSGVINRVHLMSGSFVRVPGGWKDFCNASAGDRTNPCP